MTMQNPHARARGDLCSVRFRRACSRTHVNLEIQSATTKGSLEFRGQHGEFPIVHITQIHTRALSGSYVAFGVEKRTLEPMLTWTSNRSPLRVHLLSKPTWRLFYCGPYSARTRARARARLRVVRCGSKRVRRGPMVTWKSHRSPLRAHFSYQANMATFLLWNIQRARASARTLRQ